VALAPAGDGPWDLYAGLSVGRFVSTNRVTDNVYVPVADSIGMRTRADMRGLAVMRRFFEPTIPANRAALRSPADHACERAVGMDASQMVDGRSVLSGQESAHGLQHSSWVLGM
jgi:hypothetical protein